VPVYSDKHKIEIIGKGSYGTVYLYKDKETTEYVAVKKSLVQNINNEINLLISLQ